MRRWLSRKRTPARDPIAWDRCLLALEALETRENPAPLIFPPSLPISETPEDTGVSFQDSSSFSLFNSAAFGNVHRATLSVTNGTLTVGPQAGVTVVGNGTASVELTGLIGNINAVIFGGGFSFTPTGSFSGEASVGLTVTDLGVDESGNPTTPTGTATESFTLRVRPVASPAVVSVNASGETRVLTGPFPFAPGTLTVTGWTDADGSETATVTFSLDASDPSAFRLFNGPNELSPIEPGLWRIEPTSAAELQAVFDSLALVPPPGFSGRATLSVIGELVDTASFPSSESTETTNPPRDLVGGSLNLRFFTGTNVTLPQGLTAPEGGTIDLGGRFEGEDPDLLPGDVSVFTLSAPAGLLTFSDAALVGGMTADRTVNPDGSTTITLTGDLGAINAFLATAGSLTYSAPDPDFSGALPLAVTLANRPGAAGGQGGAPGGAPVTATPADPTFAPLVIEPGPGEAPGKFGDAVPLLFTPEADDLFPLADDAVTTQDTPVAVLMSLAALPTDASEAVVLIVGGVPDGAAFTVGTDLGGGMWALALSDLDDLVFVPPPGAVGVFDLSVTAVVTDADPQSGMSDSATQATTFTITVLPAGAPVPTDDPDDVPTDDPDDLTGGFLDDFEDEADAAGEFDESADGGATGAEVSADPDGDTESRPDELETEPAVLPEGMAGSTPDAAVATESRFGSGAPGSGSLFARPEAPQPAYGGNEKHPLPPVLPLDQSSSAAGFTDSGGDSFALIDQLLRGTAPARADAAPALGPAPVAEPPGPNAGAVPANDGPTDEAAEAGEWRYWVAGSAIAGAATAWTLMSLERKGRLARALRRLRRPVPVPAH